MTQTALEQSRPTSLRGRGRGANPIPFDGEDGLFFETWYPVCFSDEVEQGQLIGRSFLDGKIIVMRGEDGKVRAQSAYCPHVGADLSVGCVVGNNVQCAFHRWEYDASGVCVKTGIGDPAPRAASLYNFPVREKWNIVWVFNGDTPNWELPEFEDLPNKTLVRTFVTDEYSCDGWIFACNTPDMQHIRAVHGIEFKHENPHKLVDWRPDGFDYNISANHQGGIAIDWRVGIRSTSFFWQRGTYDGWWFGGACGFSCPRPGFHQAYFALVTDLGDGSEEATKLASERMDIAHSLIARTAEEDRSILNTIHYMPRTLTRGDASLARYLDLVRNWPRGHSSSDFIR